MRGSAARIGISALALLLAVGAARAEAQGRRSTLSWVRLPGAEACATARDVSVEVERRLGREVFVAAGAAELVVEGRIERADAAYRATIVVSEASGAVLGERTVERETDRCEELLPTIALVIAVTIDPDAASPPEDPVPDPDPDPDPVPAPWRLEIALAPMATLGVGPFASAGGAGAFFLTPPGFVALELHGAIVPWSRAEIAGGWIDHLIAWAGIAICPLTLREGGWSLLACAGIDAGAEVVIGSSGAGAIPERERVLIGLDVAVRGHVVLAGPLFAHAALALLVPFRQEPFTMGTAPAVQPYYRPDPVGGTLQIGLGVDLAL